MGASYTSGASALSTRGQNFNTYAVNARLRVAFAEPLAMYVEYLYYFYDFRGYPRLLPGVPAALERTGADEVVTLEEDFGEPTYVFDPLWGEPLQKAVAAAAPGARIVHLGQSAGPEATLTSAAVRGKQLDLYGYSNFSVPRDVLAREYARLVSHAVAGEIRLDVERVPFERAAEAWERKGKVVFVP